MYRPGDLKLRLGPPDEYGWTAEDGPWSRYDSEDGVDHAPPFLELPHRCDEWIIGGRPAAEALLADLKDALEKMP